MDDMITNIRYAHPPKFRPVVIAITAVSIGLIFLGVALTVVGTWPGYSPYGGNPLRIIGPICLAVGTLMLMLIGVDVCVRTQKLKDKQRNAKSFDSVAGASSATADPESQASSQPVYSYGGGRPNKRPDPTPNETFPKPQTFDRPQLYTAPVKPANPMRQPSIENNAQPTVDWRPINDNGAVRSETVPQLHNALSHPIVKPVPVRQEAPSQLQYAAVNREVQPKQMYPPPPSLGPQQTLPKAVAASREHSEDEGSVSSGKRLFWGRSKGNTSEESNGEGGKSKFALPQLKMPNISVPHLSKPKRVDEDTYINPNNRTDKEQSGKDKSEVGSKSAPGRTKDKSKKGNEAIKKGVNNGSFKEDEIGPTESTPKDPTTTSRDRSRDEHGTSKDRERDFERGHQNRSSSRHHQSSGRHRSTGRDDSTSRQRRDSSRNKKKSYDNFSTIDFTTGAPAKSKKRSRSGERGHGSDEESGNHRRRRGSTGSQNGRRNRGYEPDSRGRKRTSPEDSSYSDADRSRRRNYYTDEDEDYYRGRGQYRSDEERPLRRRSRSRGASEDEASPQHRRRRHGQHGESKRKPRKPQQDPNESSGGTSADEILDITKKQDQVPSKTSTTTVVSPHFNININAQPGSSIQLGLGSAPLQPPRPMIAATPKQQQKQQQPKTAL